MQKAGKIIKPSKEDDVKQNDNKQNDSKQNQTEQKNQEQNESKQNQTEQKNQEQNDTKQNQTEQNDTKQNLTESKNQQKQNETKQNQTEQNNQQEQNDTKQNQTQQKNQKSQDEKQNEESNNSKVKENKEQMNNKTESSENNNKKNEKSEQTKQQNENENTNQMNNKSQNSNNNEKVEEQIDTNNKVENEEQLQNEQEQKQKIKQDKENSQQNQVDLDFFNQDSADDSWEYNELYRLTYISNKLSQSSIDQLSKKSSDSSKLSLPQKNSYLPSDIELISTCDINQKDQSKCSEQSIEDDQKQDYPNLIILDERMEVWHKLDRSFKSPKVSMELQFSSPIAYKNQENIANNKIFVKLLNDKINEELNDALSIGYDIQISSSLSGINIEIFGFGEKIALVVKTISNLIKNFQCDKNKLDLAKEEILQDIDEDLQDITQQALQHFKTTMLTPSANNTIIKDIISDIDDQKIMDFKNKIFSHGFVTGICIGNILEKDAKAIFIDNFKKILNYKSVKNFDDLYEYKLQISKLRNRSIVIRMPNLNKNSDNSLLLNYYQIGVNNMQSPEDFQNFLKMHILQNILHSEAFNILRTEMQLGYSVGSFLFPLDNVNGIVILIQGSKNLPDKNDMIVETRFLEKVDHILNDMKTTEFLLIKDSLKSQLLQKDLKLRERKDRYFSIINSQLYDFNTLDSLLKQLDLLTLENLQNYYKDIFHKKNGRISYQIFTDKEKDQINKQVLSSTKMYTQLENEVYLEGEKIKKIQKYQRREIQLLKRKLKKFQ